MFASERNTSHSKKGDPRTKSGMTIQRILLPPAFHNIEAIGEKFRTAFLAFGFHVAAEFRSVTARAQVDDVA